jgi:hypothetical protein
MQPAEVVLTEPITTHDGPCSKVVFRSPKYGDVFALGEPQAYAVDPESGLLFTSNRDDVIEKYVRRCVIEPKDAALLEQCNLADSLAIREAILGFFEAARSARSTTTPTSPSSD